MVRGLSQINRRGSQREEERRDQKANGREGYRLS
jgi:hypothetical protein